MRRLREDFIFGLEDAVKTRDARAIVDLQRQFERESTEAEANFAQEQERDREDQDLRLQQIREQEAEKSAEILRNQEEELMSLRDQEAKKRQELDASFQEQMAKLNEESIAKVDAEAAEFEKRKAQLEGAMAERLAAIAKGLADEEELNREGAKNILTALNETFGIGGDIDKLLKDFESRRKRKMTVEVGFERVQTEREREDRDEAAGGRFGPLRGLAFAKGGRIIAREPTVALFAEAGPEMAEFTPLNQMQQSAGAVSGRMQVDLNFSGSAPPGVGTTERDSIARVVIDALEQAGINAGQNPN